MKQTSKKPVLTRKEPMYPSVRDAAVDRRRFLTLFAGTAAASALAIGCKEGRETVDDRPLGQTPISVSGAVPRTDPPPSPPPQLGPLSKIVLPEGLDIIDGAGDIQGREVTLDDGRTISFALVFAYTDNEERTFLVSRGAELVAIAQSYMASSFRGSFIENPGELIRARADIRALTAKKIADAPGARFLDIVILSVGRHPQVRGKFPRPDKKPPPPKVKGGVGLKVPPPKPRGKALPDPSGLDL